MWFEVLSDFYSPPPPPPRPPKWIVDSNHCSAPARHSEGSSVVTSSDGWSGSYPFSLFSSTRTCFSALPTARMQAWRNRVEIMSVISADRHPHSSKYKGYRKKIMQYKVQAIFLLACLPPPLRPSLPASLTACLFPSLPACLPQSLPASLRPSLPPSLFRMHLFLGWGGGLRPTGQSWTSIFQFFHFPPIPPFSPFLYFWERERDISAQVAVMVTIIICPFQTRWSVSVADRIILGFWGRASPPLG